MQRTDEVTILLSSQRGFDLCSQPLGKAAAHIRFTVSVVMAINACTLAAMLRTIT